MCAHAPVYTHIHMWRSLTRKDTRGVLLLPVFMSHACLPGPGPQGTLNSQRDRGPLPGHALGLRDGQGSQGPGAEARGTPLPLRLVAQRSGSPPNTAPSQAPGAMFVFKARSAHHPQGSGVGGLRGPGSLGQHDCLPPELPTGSSCWLATALSRPLHRGSSGRLCVCTRPAPVHTLAHTRPPPLTRPRASVLSCFSNHGNETP